jgi:hypothetical protein
VALHHRPTRRALFVLPFHERLRRHIDDDRAALEETRTRDRVRDLVLQAYIVHEQQLSEEAKA